MDYIVNNKKQILVVILLLLGLIFGVYLVQQKTGIKSKAGADVGNGIRVSNEDGKEVKYEGNNTWRSNTTHIEISIDDLNTLD